MFNRREAVLAIQMLVTAYQISECYIPEDCIMNMHGRGTL